MPSAASSFLLLRFLCRYKENDVAVGQPRRFRFYPLSAKNQQKKKSDQRSVFVYPFEATYTILNLVSRLKGQQAYRLLPFVVTLYELITLIIDQETPQSSA
jgi:hypothetical protein